MPLILLSREIGWEGAWVNQMGDPITAKINLNRP